jgi:hypothetical protein
MTPFQILILVCSLALDHAACKPETARAMVHGPQVASAMECGLIGQTTIAQTAAEVRPDPKTEYVRIICAQNGNVVGNRK